MKTPLARQSLPHRRPQEFKLLRSKTKGLRQKEPRPAESARILAALCYVFAKRAASLTAQTWDAAMKTLACLVVVVMLAGCIPIGIRGTSITTSIDARQCGTDSLKETSAAALPKDKASAGGARCA